jgi:hypothetical protein
MKMVYTLFVLCAFLAVVPILSKPAKVNELHAKPGMRLHGLGSLSALLKRPVKTDSDEVPETTSEDGTTTPPVEEETSTPEPVPETTSFAPEETGTMLDFTSPTPGEIDDLDA